MVRLGSVRCAGEEGTTEGDERCLVPRTVRGEVGPKTIRQIAIKILHGEMVKEEGAMTPRYAFNLPNANDASLSHFISYIYFYSHDIVNRETQLAIAGTSSSFCAIPSASSAAFALSDIPRSLN